MIRRGLLWGFAAALAAAGLVHAYAWVAAPGRLPVRAVHVQGALARLDPAALQAMVAPELSDSMLTQDIAALRRRLEAEPWVRTARVRRSWPDALAVEIVEQEPVARWEAGGLLNDRGERFDPAGAEVPGLARLAGAPGREAALVRTPRPGADAARPERARVAPPGGIAAPLAAPGTGLRHAPGARPRAAAGAAGALAALPRVARAADPGRGRGRSALPERLRGAPPEPVLNSS